MISMKDGSELGLLLENDIRPKQLNYESEFTGYA